VLSLRTLLGDAGTSSFIRDHYQRLPFSGEVAAANLQDLDLWKCIVSAVLDGQGDYLICRRNQQFTGAAPAGEQEMQALSEEGFTFVVRHAERGDARLAELAGNFEKDFAAPVNIHLYSTPAAEYGFSWHYDSEEVFIVQMKGDKTYELRKNTVNPWPVEEAVPENMRYEREITPLWRCRVAAGGWLYIPSGYWHRAVAGSSSHSIALGVKPRTAIDVWDFLRARLPERLLWRQRLPVMGEAASLTPSEIDSELQNLFRGLQEDLRMLLSDPQLAERLRAYFSATG
jgi:50S ribosomal protein L16 3-hydroxylase